MTQPSGALMLLVRMTAIDRSGLTLDELHTCLKSRIPGGDGRDGPGAQPVGRVVDPHLPRGDNHRAPVRMVGRTKH